MVNTHGMYVFILYKCIFMLKDYIDYFIFYQSNKFIF